MFRSSWLSLYDEEASAFLSHRTSYSSDEAGDPSSGSLVPPDRRRRSTKREICSFPPCAASISVPSVGVFPASLKGGGTISSCSGLQTNVHTISCGPVGEPVGESEKAQVPQEGGAEQKRMQHDRHLSNGCTAAAAAARVDSHRACATGGLSSCHPISLKWVAVVCSCSLATFLGRPHDGPPNAATQRGARGPPAISSDLTRRRASSLRLVRCAPDNCRRGWLSVCEATLVIGRPG